MPDKGTILLAEDDLNLGMLLADYLESEGFEVKLCRDGGKALAAFHNHHFDLCLVDVMMPAMDGFTLAKTIRETNKEIPLIFITARSLKEDKLKGYTTGADDYITKPFDEQELLWKIKALIRRAPKESITKEVISIGAYAFDYSNQSLAINGVACRITEKESEILKFLVTDCNNVIKREALLKQVWGENDYFAGRSLDVFITKIRKYLSEDPHVHIENVFGVGFILNIKSNT